MYEKDGEEGGREGVKLSKRKLYDTSRFYRREIYNYLMHE